MVVAAIVMVVALALTLIPIAALLRLVVDGDVAMVLRQSYHIPEQLSLGVLICFWLVVSYLIARVGYRKMRWKTCAIDPIFCVSCNYDLTGNVSGVCPECGSPIPPVRAHDSCQGR